MVMTAKISVTIESVSVIELNRCEPRQEVARELGESAQLFLTIYWRSFVQIRGQIFVLIWFNFISKKRDEN
jgi:hypothetical protein